ALAESLSRFRHFSEDDIAELLLRMVGDADGCAVALDADPFMLFGEVEAHASGSLAVIAVGDERHRGDARIEELAALLQLERRSLRSERRGNIAHGDRPLQRWREPAARDLAHLIAFAVEDERTLAHRLAAIDFESDALFDGAILELGHDSQC